MLHRRRTYPVRFNRNGRARQAGVPRAWFTAVLQRVPDTLD